VVIKRPAGVDADRLVADLAAGPPGRSDAAAARLLVMGARAVPHLVKALGGLPGPEATSRLLAVLETLPASRSLVPALDRVLSDVPACAPAALAVLRAWLSAEERSLATLALDRIATLAFDPSRPGTTRAAAVEAIASLQDEAARVLLERLRDASDPLVREAASGPRTATAQAPPADEDPEQFRRRVSNLGESVPLTDLHHLLEQARARQQAARDEADRTAWQAARAAVHQALATRGSTVGLYDLRELLERLAAPPPVALVAALGAVGDQTCVEAVATAWDRVADSWTRDQLRGAMAAICARHGLTRRHAAARRLVARAHPLAEVVPASARRRPPRAQAPGR
jgi:hypothetical protein